MSDNTAEFPSRIESEHEHPMVQFVLQPTKGLSEELLDNIEKTNSRLQANATLKLFAEVYSQKKITRQDLLDDEGNLTPYAQQLSQDVNEVSQACSAAAILQRRDKNQIDELQEEAQREGILKAETQAMIDLPQIHLRFLGRYKNKIENPPISQFRTIQDEGQFQAVEDAISFMFHEARNPLTAFKGTIQIVEMTHRKTQESGDNTALLQRLDRLCELMNTKIEPLRDTLNGVLDDFIESRFNVDVAETSAKPKIPMSEFTAFLSAVLADELKEYDAEVEHSVRVETLVAEHSIKGSDWWARLLRNHSNNVADSYKRKNTDSENQISTKKLTTLIGRIEPDSPLFQKFSLDPKKAYDFIEMEDSGTGISPDSPAYQIIETGRFIKNVGENEGGQHIGMASVQESFEKEGIFLVPENRTDPDGKNIGFKLTVIVPVV